MGSSRIYVGGNVKGSLVGQFGNVTINQVSSSPAARVASESAKWLDSHDVSDGAYPVVSAIATSLRSGDERGVRGFIRRNWETIASELAATALLEAIKAFIGV